MPELEKRLHGIDRLESPDLWDAARARAASPRPPAPGPSGSKQILIIAVAFGVSAVALAFVVTAFRSGDPERPVEPPRNVMNGDLWVKVGGGEGGTAIGRVNLDSSVGGGFMWTDAPNVFADTPAASELLADDYAFSPDGSRVVFSHATAPAPGSGPPYQPVELFVMNADGSGLRQLTHDDAYAAFPAWSPDGQTIAYASYRGQSYIPGCVGLSICPSNLYLIDASGGEPSPLVTTTASETSPTWSPDGTRIAFAETSERQGTIVSVKADGSDRVELSPGGAVSFPSWSPDGTQIMFLLVVDGTNHILTATPDDSGHHDIVDTRTDTNFGRPVWSPDGTTIAFARPYAGATAVWTIDRYGNTTPQRIAGWPGFDGAPIAWRSEPSGSTTSTPTIGPSPDPRSPETLEHESFPVSGPVGAVATGDGWVWLATYSDEGRSLDKVDPSTGEVVDSIPLPDAPSYLAAGSGNVWAPITEQDGSPALLQIDAETGEILHRYPGFRGPVVLAADSTVWAIGSGITDAAEIDQLDPVSRSIINRVPLMEPPVDMVEAAGSLWALMPPTDGTERDDLVRIDPTSGDVTATLDVGSDGIWLAGNFQGVYLSSNGTEGRGNSVLVSADDNTISPFGNVYNFRPFAVADGRVWFIAGPHDGPIQGTCGLNLQTQQVDVCSNDGQGPDLEAGRDPAAYDPATQTSWTGVYLKAVVTRAQY